MPTRRRSNHKPVILPALKAGASKVLGGYLKATNSLAKKIEPYAKKLPQVSSGRVRRRK